MKTKRIEEQKTNNSFFHTMLDEKGLLDEVLIVNQDGQNHFIEMPVLVEGMEKTTRTEQHQIEMMMRKIDFHNGDMLHFMNHLAECYISQNYKPMEEDL